MADNNSNISFDNSEPELSESDRIAWPQYPKTFQHRVKEKSQ